MIDGAIAITFDGMHFRCDIGLYGEQWTWASSSAANPTASSDGAGPLDQFGVTHRLEVPRPPRLRDATADRDFETKARVFIAVAGKALPAEYAAAHTVAPVISVPWAGPGASRCSRRPDADGVLVA
jgi:hypothetical protein